MTTVPTTTTPATEPRGLPLAVRLGLVLGATVLVVLLLAGAVVNRVVSQGFEQVEAAADALGELVRVGGGPRQLAEGARIMNRLARSLNGPVTLLGPNGLELATVTPPGPQLPPQGGFREIQASITGPNGAEVGTLIAQVPASTGGDAADRPFLRLFNVALLVAGLVSVAAIAGVSVWMARRQTKPLRPWPDGSSRRRCSAAGRPATWRTTSPRRPPSSRDSCRP
jgi:hypothetical protein